MLLDNVDQALSGLEFRIFALDEDTGLLRTSWYPDGVEPLDHGWAPGTGVVGTAYQNEEWTVALGARCHDATHRLNPQEQERYKNLNTVASMPMLNARRKVVAVLTGSSSQELGVLNTPQGRAAFAKLAVAAQRLWIDVFRIAHD
ncbi:MAG: hypothetical protein JWN46_93 [Acidimicrobiales bacterium]|nr:hypothetical protein [Acidimicrobiales bacterium]